MNTLQIFTILASLASAYSVTTISGRGGITNGDITGYLATAGGLSGLKSSDQSYNLFGNSQLGSLGQLGTAGRLSGLKASDQSYNVFGNSLSLDSLYDNSANYLKNFGLNTQNIYSQLTSQDLGVQTGGQSLGSGQNQFFAPTIGTTSFVNTFKSENSFGDNGYANSIGLGAYGFPADVNSVKYSQPIQSSAPLHTRLTSSPVQVSYPSAVVSGYTPAYPPYQPATPASQVPITLGSGSLGITRLNNGNFALGAGSIGYGGTAPFVGPKPGPPQQIPIF